MTQAELQTKIDRLIEAEASRRAAGERKWDRSDEEQLLATEIFGSVAMSLLRLADAIDDVVRSGAQINVDHR